MPDPFAAKLKELGFALAKWCTPPSEKLVRDFEKRFALALPADYRLFLLNHGGVIGSASCAFQEPTPCGSATGIDNLFGFTSSDRTDNVVSATELIEGYPDVIAIGDNLMGAMFWLKCTGPDAGSVYMHDHEGRSAWPDDQFVEWFPNLDPDIKQYLALRKQGKLPNKPSGYAHVYRLANTFTGFIDSLETQEY